MIYRTVLRPCRLKECSARPKPKHICRRKSIKGDDVQKIVAGCKTGEKKFATNPRDVKTWTSVEPKIATSSFHKERNPLRFSLFLFLSTR